MQCNVSMLSGVFLKKATLGFQIFVNFIGNINKIPIALNKDPLLRKDLAYDMCCPLAWLVAIQTYTIIYKCRCRQILS